MTTTPTPPDMPELKSCPFDKAEQALLRLANTPMELHLCDWSEICNAIRSAIDEGRKHTRPAPPADCGCNHPDRHRSPHRQELLGGGQGFYCRYCLRPRHAADANDNRYRMSAADERRLDEFLSQPDTPAVTDAQREAVREFDYCIQCLALELPATIFDDVQKRWRAFKSRALSAPVAKVDVEIVGYGEYGHLTPKTPEGE